MLQVTQDFHALERMHRRIDPSSHKARLVRWRQVAAHREVATRMTTLIQLMEDGFS